MTIKHKDIMLSAKRAIVAERIQHVLGMALSLDQYRQLDTFVAKVVDDEYVLRPVSELMKFELDNEARHQYD